MTCAFVGFATVDYIDGAIFPGGAAGALAINAKKHSIESHLITILSNDKNGIWYKNILDSKQIIYSHSFLHAPSLPTCVISTKAVNESKRVWNDNGALNYQSQIIVSPDYINSFELVFLANCPQILGEHIAHQVTSRKIVYIPGPQVVKNSTLIREEILNKTLYIFANEEEWPIINQVKPLQYGLEACIHTKGQYGCSVYTNKVTYSYKATSTKVVDTTGAGDNFALGFSLSYYTYQSISKAVKQGNLYASTVIAHKGNVHL